MKVKPVIIQQLDCVAIVRTLPKTVNLKQEFLERTSRGYRGKPPYWKYVLARCVLNYPYIVGEIGNQRLSPNDFMAVRRKLLGIVTTLNPQVYMAEEGWQ